MAPHTSALRFAFIALCCALPSDADMADLSLVQKAARVERVEVPRAGTEFDAQRGSPWTLEQAAVPPTLPPVIKSATDVPTNAAEAAGIAANAAGDGAAFISALIVNCITIVVCIGIFMYLRQSYPLTYQHNVTIGRAPTKMLGSNKEEVEAALASRWGWYTAAMGASTEELIDSVGLDQAMLLQYTKVCMNILMYVGVPMICVIGPMNCAFGGQPAWKIGDYLSSLSFGNVENGSWLYWVHAVVIWYVVFIVIHLIYAAQKEFIEWRFQWLYGMAAVRANTILVDNVPDEYRSEAKLKEFFGGVFGVDNITSAYMTKDTTELAKHIARKEAATLALHEAEAAWQATDPPKDPEKRPRSFRCGDLIEYNEGEIKDAEELIKAEKDRINKEAATVGGVNMYSGFVTFKERKFAQMAGTQLYSEDRDDWKVECPPDPSDLIWADLAQTPHGAGAWSVLGYACVVGLYFAYMPLVLGISQVAASVDAGPLQSIWAGLAPTVGLQIMVGFLPTFLLLIFRCFFILKADAWAQKRLQTWYFWFQIVFVVLVVAIGGSVTEFTKTIMFDPLALPDLLGETMPGATHFYMNFLVLQWVVHAMNLMRYVMLMKWKAFCQLYDEEEARKKSEPEDQDFYGIGSRSARFTINMVIGIVFGTLSPPINFLAWMNFAMCRMVYGYLIPFAEQKKPDIGGPFWVDSLKHIFVGLIIYCIVMTGVLSGRADMDTGFTPACLAGPSLIYVIYKMRRFDNAFAWEELPITKLVGKEAAAKKQREVKGTYTQAELQ